MHESETAALVLENFLLKLDFVSLQYILISIEILNFTSSPQIMGKYEALNKDFVDHVHVTKPNLMLCLFRVCLVCWQSKKNKNTK